MEQDEVVVRKSPSPNGPVRVGALLARSRGVYRVRWEDTGEEEDVKADGLHPRAPRGSLRHQSLVDPAPIIERFTAAPDEVILRLLSERPSPMTAARIKEELEQLGLDKTAVAKAWNTARTRLAKRGHIEVVTKKGTQQKYQWNGPIADSGSSASASPADDVTVPGSEEPAQSRAATQPASAGPAPEVHGANPPSLADLLAEFVGAGELRRVEHHLTRPLATATLLARQEHSAIDDFVARVPEPERPAAEALLLCLPRRLRALDRPALLGSEQVANLLTVASAEATASGSTETDAAAAWLVRRVSAVDELAAPIVPPLFDLLSRLARAWQPSYAGAVESAAQLLSRALPKLAHDARANLDPDKLAAVLARLPLTPTGGRAAALAAVAMRWPEHIAEERWWTGVRLDELAACATGVLGGVTSRPDVAERIIRPLMKNEITAVTSRVRLGFLLGLPREFATQLSPKSVADAFGRIAANDQIVAGWTAALSRADRLETLRRDVEQARSQASAADERVRAAEQRAAELAARCDRLEETLRLEHAEARTLRSAQERQVQIDVIRALADLAAEVEELAINKAEPDVLIERVRALVAAQALEPVGSAGTELPFDPNLHEPIVGSPDPGTTVTVIRPGYQWHPSDQAVLIDKALVTTT